MNVIALFRSSSVGLCRRLIGVDTVITAVEEAMTRRVEVAVLEPNPARPLNAVTARVFSLAQKQMVTVGV